MSGLWQRKVSAVAALDRENKRWGEGTHVLETYEMRLVGDNEQV